MFEVSLAAAVIVGLLFGGKLGNLGRQEFKYVYLIFLAFLIQAGIDFIAPRNPWGGYPYLHIFTYFVLLFTMFKNRRLPGLYFILAGTALNFAVIALNGGQMPVRADLIPQQMAVALAYGKGGTHGLLLETTHLKLLGDIIYLPLPYQNQLISIGDIVISIGLFVFVFRGIIGYSGISSKGLIR